MLPVLTGQRSRIKIRDCPRSQPDQNPNIAPESLPWLVQTRLSLGFLQDVAKATSFSPARRRDAPGLRHHQEFWCNVRVTGPASQYILYWSASIGLPARSPLIRPATRRFKVRPASNHLPGLNQCARLSAEKLSRPGGIHCPFIRRRRDFARGDFQEENRELTVQGCTASAVPIRRNPG